MGAFLGILSLPGNVGAEPRPHLLWIVVDDMSANFSCYGETVIETPIVDRLAGEGLLFTRAYATSPVCSTFRSALITGMYQGSIGAHHHRSGRSELNRIELPDGVRPIPALFREAGYWTCIGSGLPGIDFRSRETKHDRRGKTDYNFVWDEAIYDSHDWAGRAPGQPFFMQVQLHGGKLRGASEAANAAFQQRAKKELGSATDPATVKLPPHYPEDPVFRNDWAAYLDSVRMTDDHVGRVIARLESEGLLAKTLVVFFTDHGISTARGKQFLYDEGTHIPLVLRGPGIEAGSVRDDLVEHIDIAALSLAAAGIPIPETMQGADLLAADYEPREAVFAARDRCGEAADRIRSVRTDSFLYIRNFHPDRPLLQPSNYKDSKAIVRRLRELEAEGAIGALTRQLFFAPQRPAEELYRYDTDTWQTQNLAENPAFPDVLAHHRRLLETWIEETGDPGDETLEVYTIETDDQLTTMKPESASYRAYQANAEAMKERIARGQ